MKKEWLEKDYYAVLGLEEEATDAAIKKAYRALAKEFHPDSPKGNAARFAEAAEAYEVLSKEREAYDKARSSKLGSPLPPEADEFFRTFMDFGSMDFGAASHRRSAFSPTLQGEVAISFEEMLQGTTRSFSTSAGTEFTVPIPAGVEDGEGLWFSQHQLGGVTGDVRILVKVEPHPLFKREGNDLRLTMAIPFEELCLGTTLKVPTLTTPVRVKVPPLTPNGSTLRVRGKGLTFGEKPGDILVKVEVKIPTELTPAMKKALEAYREASSQN